MTTSFEEGKNLAERKIVLKGEPTSYQSTYGHRGDRWNELVLPFLQDLGAAEVMRRTGRRKSAVYKVLSGKEMKYGGPAARYIEVAVKEAHHRLTNAAQRAPRHPYGALYQAQALRRFEGQSPHPHPNT